MTSIEINHKTVESARKGQEVCIKIEPVPGEAPKMVGRHFEDTDMLVSKVTVQDFFRFALTVEIKVSGRRFPTCFCCDPFVSRCRVIDQPRWGVASCGAFTRIDNAPRRFSCIPSGPPTRLSQLQPRQRSACTRCSKSTPLFPSLIFQS